MDKIIYFDYAAIAVFAVLIFSARYVIADKTNANRAFMIAVVQLFVTTVFDIISVYLDIIASDNIALKYFSHSGYLLMHVVSSLFYLFYLIALTDSMFTLKKHKLLTALLCFPSVFFAALVVLNLTGTLDLFHFDADGMYTRGDMFIWCYIVGALNMLIGIVYIIAYRKLFTIRWIITLFVPYPFIGMAMLIQFMKPNMIMEMFFNALALMFVFTNIQKPEELMDYVTGLGNEKSYESTVKKIVFNKKPSYLIVVDIQNFNNLEDVMDYQSIRSFLRHCADDIRELVRSCNMKADLFTNRSGRFYIIADVKYSDSIKPLSENLLQSFNGRHNDNGIFMEQQALVFVISLPDDTADLDRLIRYTAGSSSMFDSGRIYYLSEILKDRNYKILLNINSIIIDALKFKRFEVYFQPIYSCRLKKFVSAEALVRLNDPDFGLISPAMFIPAAEQNGVIDQISDSVLDQVCRFIASDIYKKLGIEYIEANLSAQECANANLKNRVMSAINRYGISTRSLALEITETAFVYDAGQLKENLTSIAREGIKFCLDDYGTGYSDTRRIIDLPLSIIKLDRSFISGMNRKLNQVIVKDTIKMIVDTGHHTVAEGVEDKETMQLLEDFGCDLIQGYLFSKPLPKAQFIKLCLEQRKEN